MIVSKSWHSCDGSGCILPTVETDEGESLQETKQAVDGSLIQKYILCLIVIDT